MIQSKVNQILKGNWTNVGRVPYLWLADHPFIDRPAGAAGVAGLRNCIGII
jgi:hypothetical protein